MAYDDGDQARYRGEPGFREELDFRTSTSTGSIPPVRGGGQLDDIFDDPSHGDPGRDRMAVHFAWEAILLIGVGVVGFLLYSQHKSAVTGSALTQLVAFAGALGLLTFAAAVSLRVAAPNLAIGPVAVAASVYFAKNGDHGILSAGPKIIGLAALVGLGIAIVVVAFHVPGWAGSLAGVLAVIVWIQKQPGPVTVAGGFDPTDRAWYYFGGFAAVSIVGALLCTIRPVRRGIGRFRPVGDPASRRGGFAGFVTGAAIVGSTAVAALAGMLFAGLSSTVRPDLGLDWTGLAIGAALVGGVSAYGRRGGVFGTVLGTVVVALVIRLGEAADWRVSPYAIAAATLVAGLIVTRLVETFGRPLLSPDDESWSAEATSTWTGTGWTGSEAGSWASSLPAQTTSVEPESWRDDRWSTNR